MFLARIGAGELSSALCMQSPYWASLKEKHGWEVHAFHLSGSTLLVLTRTFFHACTLAYVPFGPQEPVSLKDLSLALKKFLPKRVIAIRYDLPFGMELDCEGARVQHDSVQPDATIIIPLQGGYEQVAKGYRKRARRKLKECGEKIEVRSWDGSKREFNLFFSLYEQTGRRDGFSTRSKEYLWDVLHGPEGATRTKLFLAWRNRQIVGGTVLLYGPQEAVYLYGASARMPDCSAGYALQDAMIRFACGLHIPRYDLFGVSAKDGRGAHLKSLDLFKSSFGGEVVERKPTMDWPLRPILYHGFTFAEYLRYRVTRGF